MVRSKEVVYGQFFTVPSKVGLGSFDSLHGFARCPTVFLVMALWPDPLPDFRRMAVSPAQSATCRQ
ncbi:protein of unknown function [Pseudomonas sp. JV241A]|nr:protein of unknown function [Pseudomonas sp. JV241A]